MASVGRFRHEAILGSGAGRGQSISFRAKCEPFSHLDLHHVPPPCHAGAARVRRRGAPFELEPRRREPAPDARGHQSPDQGARGGARRRNSSSARAAASASRRMASGSPRRVREALDRLAEAVRDVTDKSNPRRIRVSVVPSFAARWLLPRIGRFIAAHPDIDLDVRATLVLVDFQRDDVDFAVRHGHGNWPGVVAEPMFDETYFPVCSPRLNRGRLPAVPADLSRHVLLRSDGEPWQPWFRPPGSTGPSRRAGRSSTTRRTWCRRRPRVRASRSHANRCWATTFARARSCACSTSAFPRRAASSSSIRHASPTRPSSRCFVTGSSPSSPPIERSRRPSGARVELAPARELVGEEPLDLLGADAVGLDPCRAQAMVVGSRTCAA